MTREIRSGVLGERIVLQAPGHRDSTVPLSSGGLVIMGGTLGRININVNNKFGDIINSIYHNFAPPAGIGAARVKP
jgi:hypothetical protein